LSTIRKEHILRALADTGASSSIILEAYTSAPFIKTDEINTTTWSTMGGKFTTIKLGYSCDIFTPRVQSQEKICSSWAFHVDDRSESTSTYDMIIGNQLIYILGESGIIMSFNDHMVTWDTDTIPMKDRDT
jgi:hypothetical protein